MDEMASQLVFNAQQETERKSKTKAMSPVWCGAVNENIQRLDSFIKAYEKVKRGKGLRSTLDYEETFRPF